MNNSRSPADPSDISEATITALSVGRAWRYAHGGKLLAAELLELRRGLVTQHLAHGARRAADADGDAGAAGYESEPDIDPGLADLATRVSSAFKGSKVV
jgi:hypothetical protein